MVEWVARNTTRGTVLAERVAIAESLLARTRGLLGTRVLARSEALLLRPCRQVHSFFMRYALDLVFVDRQGRVLLTRQNFGTNRISPLVMRANAVLELAAGALASTPTETGDVLSFEPRQESAGGEKARWH
jgi:uncharacterized membrane protein (UPF0127 family)